MCAKGWLKPVAVLHARAVHARRTRVLAERFVELIPRGHRVLDVGCGDGLIDELVMRSRPDLDIRGVDVFIRPDARIPVEEFDGTTLPFPDNSFDTVMACDVLHHTPEPRRALGELARVARHSVVVKDHVLRGFLARPTLRFMDFVGNAPHGVALPFNYLTGMEWDDYSADCGLTPVERIDYLRLYPWYADVLFGRRLHFIARFVHGPGGGLG